ncbi:mechanosensitive ion channel domain-containing protein [Marinobacterium sedimentorum]|uniref:mechanosensitive ion channel domain-containing protein n=1 Tax=Marinobacterium sedimentorum TaxID=2927804 RepID=UPI0020C67289|nr:mechanosensitive ion channel domain-containing protein [Marinobacterium sedimentorum]MCP8686162.1 mechanosensitive ion channel [Marinobacterium sedimentorum]
MLKSILDINPLARVYRGIQASIPALLILVLLLGNNVWAGPDEDIALITERLAQYEGKTPSPDEQGEKDRYQQALDALQDLKQYDASATQLRQELETLPEDIRRLRQPPSEASNPQLSATDALTLEQLQQRQTLLKASMLDQQKARDQLQQEISLNESKRLSLRDQLAQLKQTSEPAADLNSNSEASQLLQNARLRARSAQIQSLELELLTLPGRAELNELQLQQLNRDISASTQQLQQLEELIQWRLRSQTEKTLSELQQSSLSGLDPVLQAAGEQNRNLSLELRDTLAGIEQTSDLRRQQGAHLARVDEAYRTISQQLELEIQYVGTELHRLQAGLTRPLNTASTRARINQLRLQNIRLNRDLLGTEQELGGYETSAGLQLPQEARSQYRQLLTDRLSLFGKLRDARLSLVAELSSLLSVQENINERITQARTLISEQLLWLPSVTPIQLNWFGELADSRRLLLKRWQKNAAQPLLRYSSRLALPLLGLVLLCALALLLLRYQRARQQLWHQDIGNVLQDRFVHTALPLVLAPVIALPLPLLLLITARYALNPGHPDFDVLAFMLHIAALMVWVIHFLRIWLHMPHGLFVGHFGVAPELARVLRQRLLLLGLSCGPLLLGILYVYTTTLDSEVMKSGLERLLMLSLTGVITLLWGSLLTVAPQLNRLTQSSRWWFKAEVWLGCLVGFNFILLVMMLVGYVFTSQIFMILLLLVMVVCLSVFVAYGLGLRWLLIAERKLAFDRAQARQAEITAAREKNEDEPSLSTDYLNMQDITEQSRKLLATTSLILLLGLLWLVLRDFLPALDVFDKLVLWSNISSTNEGDVLTSVTFKNLLFAALLLGLSIFAASNLPGLLELLILRHMTLSPGTGYAITTLIKYALVVIGIFVCVGELGLQWSKLQWLVAALSVGLGFGLQEIVANFVSGLIILFEKPMRIGDTVTIGGVSGTVTRIHIRGTTIVDWDRKEVIIPNKTFITDQLINWSLTDPTTRVVIRVGVAYGSDTEQARGLLVEAARETERVLSDPLPEAFFTGFGASTLDLELRLFVSAMSDRMVVTHNVNTTIDRKFKHAGLEIAFPQLDVHLHPGAGTQEPTAGDTRNG